MILDFLFEAIAGLISVLTRLLPRMPVNWLSWVRSIKSSAGSLATNVPYVDVLPWTGIKVAAGIVPGALVLSVAIRVVRTLVAWLRSRGVSSE